MEELKESLSNIESQEHSAEYVNEVAEQLLEIGQHVIQQAALFGGVVGLLTSPLAIAFFVGILSGCIMNLISAWTGKLPLRQNGVVQDQEDDDVATPESN